MSSINGRQVTYAVTHTNLFVPGLGEIRKELSNVDNGTHKSVDMLLDGDFVVLTTKNKAGAPVTIAVPLSNFSHLVLARE